MGTITIDGMKVAFTDEKNILTIIRKAGIDVPTLCYKTELSTFGDCRLCTVEDDRGRMFATCSEEPRDGMVIYTNTGRLRRYRKLIIELLLSAHHRDCTTCDMNGDCNLQTLARRFGVLNVRFDNYKPRQELDFSSPAVIRDPNKCILCGNCVRVCSELQGIEALGYVDRGSDSTISPAFGRLLAETDCVNCGQCRVYCPTAAITIRHNRNDVWEALSDPGVRVVAQIAPALRVSVSNAFGVPNDERCMGRIVNVMHRMGFDEVYDTAFSADLTIIEESREFVERLRTGENLPLFTSCCPSWVKFVADQYPEFSKNVSTCRSPMGMMSAVAKEYYSKPENNPDGRRTVMVAIMPCTAKKMEIDRPNSYTDGRRDTDFVLTTVELIDMIRTTGISFAELDPEASDIPFGIGSGAGVIFGVSGGVTEAVIRRLAQGHGKQELERISETVRGDDLIREFSIPYEGRELNICILSGLANAHTVMEQLRSGEKHYDLIEVMACRRGCINGGGQPRLLSPLNINERRDGIFVADRASVVKKSNENPLVMKLYDGLLRDRAHELLHNREFCGQ